MAFMRNIQAMLKGWVDNDVFHLVGRGAPVDGTSGTGVGIAGLGSTYIDAASGSHYRNSGTKASPTWGVNTFLVRDISIPAAMLILLRQQPIELIPAPGPGKVIDLISGVAIADNLLPFVVGSNDIVLRYRDATGPIITQPIDTSGFLDQANGKLLSPIRKLIGDVKIPRLDIENQPVLIHNSGGSELSGGTGTLRLRIRYLTLDTEW